MMSDEEYTNLAAQHGGEDKVRRVDTEFGTVVVRKPNRAETRRAVSLGLLDQTFTKTLDAVDPLLRSCVVAPSRQTLDTWIEDRPLLPLAFAGVFIEMVSGTAKEEQKKLQS